MTSLIQKIRETENLGNWRFFRVSQATLRNLLSALRGLSSNIHESEVSSVPEQHIIRIDGFQTELLVSEIAQLSPTPFRWYHTPHTIAITKNPQAITEFLRIHAENELSSIPIVSMEDKGDTLEWSLLENFEHQSKYELLCRTYQAIQMEDALEQEGEELFQLFGRKVRALLCPDYVEIQAENPSDYYAGRSSGWVWRDSSFSGTDALDYHYTSITAGYLSSGKSPLY